LHELTVGASGEGTQRAFAKKQPEVHLSRRVEREDGLRREQRIAAVVAFPDQYEEAGGAGELSQLTKILHHRRAHRMSGALHRGPFFCFVAAKQSLLEAFCASEGKDGMTGDRFHQGSVEGGSQTEEVSFSRFSCTSIGSVKRSGELGSTFWRITARVRWGMERK